MKTGTRLLSLKAVEAEYGLSTDSVEKLIHDGQLPVIQPPGIRKRFISRRAFEECLASWTKSGATS